MVSTELQGAHFYFRLELVTKYDDHGLRHNIRAPQFFNHAHAATFAQIQINDDRIDWISKDRGDRFEFVVRKAHDLNVTRCVQKNQ